MNARREISAGRSEEFELDVVGVAENKNGPVRLVHDRRLR
ncbi:MAG: hypothetical protein QOH48_1058 [Actinomycetota bacterium]|nr:hypothetical protein [Actinomycetota bacterium]